MKECLQTIETLRRNRTFENIFSILCGYGDRTAAEYTDAAALAETHGTERDAIRPGDDLVADLGMDSLEIRETVTGLEKQYGIVLINGELAQTVTVLGLARAIEGELDKAEEQTRTA